MELQDMINVMHAFKNGNKIQVFNDCTGIWEDCVNPVWNWECEQYRIWKDQIINDLTKCTAFKINHIDDKTIVTITSYNDSGCYWNELLKRLIVLKYDSNVIYIDFGLRNGSNNRFFNLIIKPDKKYILQPISKSEIPYNLIKISEKYLELYNCKIN